MNDIVSIVDNLGSILSVNEIIVYSYISQSKENKIDLQKLFKLVSKNKVLDILRKWAENKIISGTIQDNCLEIKSISLPERLTEEFILGAVVTKEKRGGRVASALDVREVIMDLVPENEKHIARKLIRSLIVVCLDLNITDRALNTYLKSRIEKGIYWKEVLSTYSIRETFDKNFDKEEIE